jgi:hypothetical protein
MKVYEQEVSRLQMARDNLLLQRARLLGQHDPVSLVALDHVVAQLTLVGRDLKALERLGVYLPSLKS